MQFWHRKRASRQLPRSRNYSKKVSAPGISSLVAYKAGMTQLVTLDESDAPTKNMEISRACTVLEYPRTELYGIRLYRKDPTTSYEFAETEVYDADAAKKLGIKNAKTKPESFKDKLAGYSNVAALLVAYPKTTSMSKNHPDRFESRVSGKDVQEKFDFLVSKLGKEVKVADVFKSGEEIDLMAVTTGKGWQGPIKRHGVSRLFHKATQKIRHVGAHGAFARARCSTPSRKLVGWATTPGRSTTSAYSSWGPRKPPAR